MESTLIKSFPIGSLICTEKLFRDTWFLKPNLYSVKVLNFKT